MEKHRPYTNIIENKLQQLPGADVNDLWSGMHTILDQKMPQQKKKGRAFGWLFAGKSILICSSILILGASSFFLSKNSSSKQSLQSTIILNDQQQKDTREKATEESSSNSGAVFVSDKKDISKERRNDWVDIKTDNTKNYCLKNSDRAASVLAKSAMGSLLSERNKKDVPQFRSVTDDPTGLHGLHTSAISSSQVIISSRLRKMHIAENERSMGPTTVSSNIDKHFTNKLEKEIDSLAELKRRLIHRDENRGMYVGIMAGLDLSSVHFNSFNSGTNTGLLLGYALNKKWSIETGLYWNKKNFIGDSGTFTLKNYTVQQGVKILSAKGEVHLYELPVSVRYNLLPYQNKLFLAAGISSYFMKWENYRYGYEYYGQSGYSYFSPQNATTNWFSVANFSVGYSCQLGMIGIIRVEPYLKMPIKNIGFCNMAVMSTGLNLGFTRQLSRN